jgi:iron-sulfur cluster repair protein YtfE (RIC family)
MLASHLVEVNELSAPQLCHYINQKYYTPLLQALGTQEQRAAMLQHSDVDPEKMSVAHLLFTRLKEEVEQVIRNDRIIVFPVVEKLDDSQTGTPVRIPFQMVRDKNKKIISILEKLRQVANNFILRPEWDADTRLFFEELFLIDQMISQSIYLKENVLLPKLQRVYGC